MSLKTILDQSTSPQIAIPLGVGGGITSWLGYLPLFINVSMAIYVVMLIAHKGWQMYKEWRDDPTAPGHGDGRPN